MKASVLAGQSNDLACCDLLKLRMRVGMPSDTESFLTNYRTSRLMECENVVSGARSFIDSSVGSAVRRDKSFNCELEVEDAF
jgi:hypothetical protein